MSSKEKMSGISSKEKMQNDTEKQPEIMPLNFEDKVRVYTTVPTTPEVLEEFRRLAKGGKGTTHFGDDWKPEHYAELLRRIGDTSEEE